MRHLLVCLVALCGACGERVVYVERFSDGGADSRVDADEPDAWPVDASGDAAVDGSDAAALTDAAADAAGDTGVAPKIDSGTAGTGGDGGTGGSGGAVDAGSGTGGVSGAADAGGTGGVSEVVVWSVTNATTDPWVIHPSASRTYEVTLGITFSSTIPGCANADNFFTFRLGSDWPAMPIGFVGQREHVLTSNESGCVRHGAEASARVRWISTENGAATSSRTYPVDRPGPHSLPQSMKLRHTVRRFSETSEGVGIDETWELLAD